jgi:hypothetical protein
MFQQAALSVSSGSKYRRQDFRRIALRSELEFSLTPRHIDRARFQQFVGLLPIFKSEFMKYPAICRSQEGIKIHCRLECSRCSSPCLCWRSSTPCFIMAVPDSPNERVSAHELEFFSLHLRNPQLRQSQQRRDIDAPTILVAYSIEWLAVGIVIGLIYRPAIPR